MQHVARCVVAAVGSAALLAACSPAQPAPAGPTSVGSSPSSSSSEAAGARASALELADGSRVILAGQAPEAIGDIGYGGTLVLLDGGCWGFAQYGSTDVLLLPQGSTPGPDGSSVVTPDGVTLRVGDQTYSGGYGVGDGTPEDGEWRAVAPECFEGRRGNALVGIRVTGPSSTGAPTTPSG